MLAHTPRQKCRSAMIGNSPCGIGRNWCDDRRRTTLSPDRSDDLVNDEAILISNAFNGAHAPRPTGAPLIDPDHASQGGKTLPFAAGVALLYAIEAMTGTGPLSVLLALLLLMPPFADGAASAATTPACVIDMGSNSFRRIVGSFDQGRYRQTRIEKRTLGVGDDVARHGRISEAKLAEIRQALMAFRDMCRKDGVSPVRAIGTAAFRDATNGPAVVQMARGLGIEIEIATEKRESELAYLVGSLGRDGYAVIDNGSRSIELVGKGGGPLRYRVVTLGYRVAYDQYFAPASNPSAAVASFRDRLRSEASQANFMKGRTGLVGVEFGEMAELLFEPAALEGRVLTLADLQRKVQQIAAGTPAAFRALKQRPDIDRALPRLVAAATLTEAFGYSRLALTERELGVGLIIEAGLQR